MSGHSKWATIKRSKAANDAKRGKLFTKLGHEIAVAAREGGADPDMNFRLRIALDKAKQANMPKDNIERAIKRGAGLLGGGEELQEWIYEGYGPHGTAIMVVALTDNKNRAVSDIRRAFDRFGGNLGSDGCVAWMFSRKGELRIKVGDEDPDEVALMAIDAGASDFEVDEELVTVYAEPEDFKTVEETLSDSYEVAEAQLSWIPQSRMSLDEKETIQTMKLVEALEELDDVQQVFSNMDISDDVLAKYQSQAA
jgi:YebC/PmpR family DNA-binding regulatory protein